MENIYKPKDLLKAISDFFLFFSTANIITKSCNTSLNTYHIFVLEIDEGAITY